MAASVAAAIAKTARTSRTALAPWLILPLRLVLFAAIQAAVSLAMLGSPDPWSAAGAWWPLTAALANGVTVAALVLLYRREGGSFFAQLRFNGRTVKFDLPVMLGFVLIALPLAILPNIGLAMMLFGNSEAAVDLLVRPLPAWAVYLALATFPLTIAFAELPAYFKYAMPRLEAATGSSWLAVALPALFLAAQHVTLPLLFDGRFILWRLFMFLPFALFVGIALRWRPRLLPYFMGLHALMDAATIGLFLARIA